MSGKSQKTPLIDDEQRANKGGGKSRGLVVLAVVAVVVAAAALAFALWALLRPSTADQPDRTGTYSPSTSTETADPLEDFRNNGRRCCENANGSYVHPVCVFHTVPPYEEVLSWDQARRKCVNQPGPGKVDLPAPDSEELWNAVHDQIERYDDAAWMGFEQGSDGHWYDLNGTNADDNVNSHLAGRSLSGQICPYTKKNKDTKAYLKMLKSQRCGKRLRVFDVLCQRTYMSIEDAQC